MPRARGARRSTDASSHAGLFEDRESVDLVIIVGTALKVAPVSELIGHMPHSVPVLLINRTPVLHIQSDIQLLGGEAGAQEARLFCPFR